jgi:hypothetical protein
MPPVPSTVSVPAETVGAMAQSPGSGETRLQNLQHYQVALQLLELELAKYRDLRNQELKRMTPVAGKVFRHLLAKDMQKVWDRMNDPMKDASWQDNIPAEKRSETHDKETANRSRIETDYKSFLEALADPHSEAARSWDKVFEDLPSEKEIRAQKELINLFTHERDQARAALK